MNQIQKYPRTQRNSAQYQLISQQQYQLKKYTIINQCQLVVFSHSATELLTIFDIKDIRKKKVNRQVRLFTLNQTQFESFKDFNYNFKDLTLVNCFFIEEEKQILLGWTQELQLWSYDSNKIQLVKIIFQSDDYPPEALSSLHVSNNYIVAGGKSMYIFYKGSEIGQTNTWELFQILCINFIINSVFFSQSQKQIICKSQKFQCLFIIQKTKKWIIIKKICFPDFSVESILASKLYFAGDFFLISLKRITQWNKWGRKLIKSVKKDDGALAELNQLNQIVFYAYYEEIKIFNWAKNNLIEQQTIPFNKTNPSVGHQYSASKDGTHFIHFDKKFYIWKNQS